jgi:hypothetical protein
MEVGSEIQRTLRKKIERISDAVDARAPEISVGRLLNRTDGPFKGVETIAAGLLPTCTAPLDLFFCCYGTTSEAVAPGTPTPHKAAVTERLLPLEEAGQNRSQSPVTVSRLALIGFRRPSGLPVFDQA